MRTPAVQRVKVVAVAAAAVALAATISGCSSRPSESSTTATTPTTATTVPVSPSASNAPPAEPRPLTEFFEENRNDPQYSFYSFATPGGHIQCRVEGGGLPCQTEKDPHIVDQGDVCGFYPGLEKGRAVRFGYFDQRRQPCATIIQGDGFISPHVLGYGQSVTAELSSGITVTCASAVEGLTCTPAGGTGARGFFLSVDSFRVF